MLEDDDVGPEPAEQDWNDPPEHRQQRLVTGARGERHVRLEADAVTAADLVRESSAREQRASVLVEIDVEDLPRVEEAVHHPVAVMGVDVDVGDPMAVPNGSTDRDRHVVEDAETARPVGVSMMEPSSRMEGGPAVLERVVERVDRALDDPRGRLVAPPERRRVPAVEEDLPCETARLLHEIEVLRAMERLERRAAGHLDRVGPPQGARRRLGGDRLEESSGESPAALGERMVRAKVVIEEAVRPDGMSAGRRHGSLPSVHAEASPRTGVAAGRTAATFRRCAAWRSSSGMGVSQDGTAK